MLRSILAGILAVLVLFVVVSGWIIYHAGAQGKATGLGALAGHTIVSPIFWLACMGVFFLTYVLTNRLIT